MNKAKSVVRAIPVHKGVLLMQTAQVNHRPPVNWKLLRLLAIAVMVGFVTGFFAGFFAGFLMRGLEARLPRGSGVALQRAAHPHHAGDVSAILTSTLNGIV